MESLRMLTFLIGLLLAPNRVYAVPLMPESNAPLSITIAECRLFNGQPVGFLNKRLIARDTNG